MFDDYGTSNNTAVKQDQETNSDQETDSSSERAHTFTGGEWYIHAIRVACFYIKRDACNRKKVCSLSEGSYERGAYSYKKRGVFTHGERSVCVERVTVLLCI